MLGYLDPGSGSLIASAAAAGLAGAAVSAKVGWARLTGRRKNKSDVSEAPEETPADTPESSDAS